MKLTRIYEYDDAAYKINKLIKSGELSNIKLALTLDQTLNDGEITKTYEYFFPNSKNLAKDIHTDKYSTKLIRDKKITLPLLPNARILLIENNHTFVDSSMLPRLESLEVRKNIRLDQHIHSGKTMTNVFIYDKGELRSVSYGGYNSLYEVAVLGGKISPLVLKQLNNVVELSINDSNVPEIKHEFPRLQSLLIFGSDVDEIDFKKMPKLTEIRVDNTKIRDVDLIDGHEYDDIQFTFNELIYRMDLSNVKSIKSLEVVESDRRKSPLNLTVPTHVEKLEIDGNINLMFGEDNTFSKYNNM